MNTEYLGRREQSRTSRRGVRLRSKAALDRLLTAAAVAALLVAPRAVAADEDGEPELDKYKAVFAEQLGKIAAERDKALADALSRHAQMLSDLEMRFQLAGDLKPLLAVREERRRFEADPAVTSIAPVSAPEALGALQTQYIERYKQIQLGSARRVLDLSVQYRRRLDALQKELTREGRIEEALKVLHEAESVAGKAAVLHARAQIAAGGLAPTEQPMPEPEVNALDVKVEDLAALLNGEVTAWNPQTRELTCRYDFSDEAQLRDWHGGTIDPLRERLVCDEAVVKYQPPFERVLRVEYEGSHFSGTGPVRAAVGENVFGDVEPGADARALLHEGNPFFPLHKSQGGAQSFMKYACRLVLENGSVKWSVGSRDFPAQKLKKHPAQGAVVSLGHAEAKTMFDNVSVTGVLGKDALEKIKAARPAE
jgi:hypothetical protein